MSDEIKIPEMDPHLFFPECSVCEPLHKELAEARRQLAERDAARLAPLDEAIEFFSGEKTPNFLYRINVWEYLNEIRAKFAGAGA